MVGSVDRRGRRKKPRRPVERQSNEFVGYTIMGYLVLRHENREPGCSPFHLTTRVVQLKSQRQERIQGILDLLEESGLVKVQDYDRASYYEATQEGVEWYKTSAKRFFDPFMSMYRRPP